MEYQCSNCKTTDVPLWRQYQTFLEHMELFCAYCAYEYQGVDKADIGNVIGWLVPAVPAKPNTFWGFTSIPTRDFHDLSYDILMKLVKKNILQYNESLLDIQCVIMDDLMLDDGIYMGEIG